LEGRGGEDAGGGIPMVIGKRWACFWHAEGILVALGVYVGGELYVQLGLLRSLGIDTAASRRVVVPVSI